MLLDMNGREIPMNKSYNAPAYDLATGRYINQPRNVKCWTKGRVRKYTTCYNPDSKVQLRKGKPPKKKVKKIKRKLKIKK